jgi:hypothetical protein
MGSDAVELQSSFGLKLASGGVLICSEEVAETRRRRVDCRGGEEDDAPLLLSRDSDEEVSGQVG